MINEATIAGALCKAIAPLKTIENDVDYLYEVNQVLNRFKSNIYSMMDETESDLDPATLLNITITGSRQLEDFGGAEVIVDRSPITLRVYGVRGYGFKTAVLGADFMHQVDISDIFRGDAIAQFHSDHFISNREGAQNVPRERDYRIYIANEQVRESRIGMHFDGHITTDRRYVISMIMSGIIFPEVLERGRRKSSDKMKSVDPVIRRSVLQRDI